MRLKLRKASIPLSVQVFNSIPISEFFSYVSKFFSTYLSVCNYTCHEVCVFGDDKDKIKCSAIDQETGNCRICKKKCPWDKHKNAKFIIQSRQVTQYVVPEELVKHWNFNTNSLEGAALDAMKEYITLQDQLNSTQIKSTQLN